MGAQKRKRRKRIRQHVILRDGLVCCYCESPLTLETVTMEHIVPDSKRGTFNSTNLTVSCSACNNKRGNKPFFEFCKEFDFSDEKTNKYRQLYFLNLHIKVLNIAKEECLTEQLATPIILINRACKILRIKPLDFSTYLSMYKFDMDLNQECERKHIKYCFEQLIKLIESEGF